MWYPEGNEHSLQVFDHCCSRRPCLCAGSRERCGKPVSSLQVCCFSWYSWYGSQCWQLTRMRERRDSLGQEVQQLKNQNEPDFLGWFRTNAAVLLSTLVVVIGGLIGLFRWFGDRRSEREKRNEERFQTAIERLGSANQATQVGAAITLRTFLGSGY